MSQVESSNDSELFDVRREIDQIDEKIIQLLTLRSKCVEQIAEIKCRQNLSIYDSSRENNIIEKFTRDNPTHYQSVDMANIFHAILRAGLNQQLLYRAEHEG
ncbi:chorismate mutase [Aliikangiella coralliicola]|uniref:chorismate mutase n=1 Tax=Aliikangiella coralliicola TaxID=2592383 RepID=A0A545U4P3_9GAMM|nr:chorismate mutase [Aliikangiella coralliicola]TQV84414.1 chorismate mutase [Aliikangiella coralliicola]